MTTEVFTRTYFRSVLPTNTKQYFEYGEWVFEIPIGKDISIKIRSSINEYGYADETGENSIRLILYDPSREACLAKLQFYITRVPGWEERLISKIEKLKKLSKEAGYCPSCHVPKHVFVVKKHGPNYGRIFAKCTKCDAYFVWLEKG